METNSFIEALVAGACETLHIQCDLEATVGNFRRREEPASGDIAGQVAVESSLIQGSIAVVFPKTTFLAVMGRLVGKECTEIDEEIRDGAGELVNIIYGEAKSRINKSWGNLAFSLPQILEGGEESLLRELPSPAIVIPITTPAGELFLDVSLETV